MFEDFFAALCNFQPVEEITVIDFLALFGALVLKKRRIMNWLSVLPNRLGRVNKVTFA